jgi:hypothetical protein
VRHQLAAELNTQTMGSVAGVGLQQVVGEYEGLHIFNTTCTSPISRNTPHCCIVALFSAAALHCSHVIVVA